MPRPLQRFARYHPAFEGDLAALPPLVVNVSQFRRKAYCIAVFVAMNDEGRPTPVQPGKA